jgi:hypothetical protein
MSSCWDICNWDKCHVGRTGTLSQGTKECETLLGRNISEVSVSLFAMMLCVSAPKLNKRDSYVRKVYRLRNPVLECQSFHCKVLLTIHLVPSLVPDGTKMILYSSGEVTDFEAPTMQRPEIIPLQCFMCQPFCHNTIQNAYSVQDWVTVS